MKYKNVLLAKKSLRFLLLLCTVLISFKCFSQDTSELHVRVFKERNISKDTLIELYSKLCIEFSSTNIDSAMKYGKLAIEGVSSKLNLSISGKAFFSYGFVLFRSERSENIELALQILKTAEEHLMGAKDWFYLAKTHNVIGACYSSLLNFEKSTNHYLLAINYFEKCNNKCEALMPKGNIILNYISLDNFEKARKRCWELLVDSCGKNDSLKTAIIYSNLGVTYLADKPNLTIFYLNKALGFININNKERFKDRGIISSVANIYLQYTRAYTNLYILNGKANDYSKAKSFALLALEFCKANNVLFYMHTSYDALSSLYYLAGETDSSIYLAHVSRGIASKNSIKANLSIAYENLYKSFERKKRYDSAFYYFKNLGVMKEAIRNDEVQRRMLNSEVENKLAKIESDNTYKISLKNRAITIRNLYILILSLVSFLIIFIIIYFNFRKQKKWKKQFALQLIISQEEERGRIAKELHDGIGQSLLLMHNSSVVQTDLINETIEDLRTISRNLHPVQLDKLGFTKAVERIIKDIEKLNKISFSYELDNLDKILNKAQQINLYRIIQECTNNIIKHSNATDARVLLINRGVLIELNIMDNGIGFDLLIANRNYKNLGINSITERCSLLGAKIDIRSSCKGTNIQILMGHAK